MTIPLTRELDYKQQALKNRVQELRMDGRELRAPEGTELWAKEEIISVVS